MTRAKLFSVIAAAAGGLVGPLLSHETNFGISPSTLHKGGWHVETNFIVDQRSDLYRGDDRISNSDGKRLSIIRNETVMHYGVNAEFTVGLMLPTEERARKIAGRPDEQHTDLAPYSIEAKHRLFKIDSFAGTNYASLIAVITPGGEKTDRLPLDDGADAYLIGLGASFVRPSFSYWINGAMRFHDKESGFSRANETIASVAMGYRPWIAEKDEFEFNYMAEANYEHENRSRGRDGEVGDSGREILFLTPGLRMNYNRQLLKAAVQLPVHQKVHGTQLAISSRFKLGWEWMF